MASEEEAIQMETKSESEKSEAKSEPAESSPADGAIAATTLIEAEKGWWDSLGLVGFFGW